MPISKRTAIGFIAGNQEAIEKVYLEYKNLMYFVIAAYVKNQDDCDDVLSEAFLKAVEHKDQLKDPNKLKSFLCSIAKNKAIDFMKKVPTTWDEVKFIDGYPGKYVILARRCGDKWIVAGVNADSKPMKKSITLPMFAAKSVVSVYSDDAQLNGSVKEIKLNKQQQITVNIPTNGGVVICSAALP